MGNYALEPATGDGNTAIGNNAGLTIVAGLENTFLGNDVDANAAGRTNATAIGSGAVVTADNAIQLGNGSVTTVNTSGNIVTSGSVTIGSGQAIQTVLSASATLDFPSTAAGSNSDLTITVNGAAVGDPVFLGTPAVNPTSTCYTAWVSVANTVTVRFNDYQAAGLIDPGSGTFRVAVFHF